MTSTGPSSWPTTGSEHATRDRARRIYPQGVRCRRALGAGAARGARCAPRRPPVLEEVRSIDAGSRDAAERFAEQSTRGALDCTRTTDRHRTPWLDLGKKYGTQ